MAAEARVSDLDGAGCRLRVYDYGGPPERVVLMTHGIEDCALSMAPLAESLAASFRVLAFDLRGHGDSEKPGFYSFPHFLADLHALILQLELERPALIGHSLGGQIATRYASVFTEVPAAVVNLDGLGPPVRMPPIEDEDRQWQLRTGIEGLLGGGRNRRPLPSAEDAAALYSRFHPRLQPEVVARLVDLGTEPDPRGGLRWKWDPRLHSLRLFDAPGGAESQYSWIECPVLWVTAGEIDEFIWRRRGFDPAGLVPDAAEIDRRLALFRDARHANVEGAGHHLHLEAPEKTLAAVRSFLDDVLA